MFRDLLSSRLIQVGLVFFVVVVGGSLLYSWQTDRTTEAEFAGINVVPHETRSEQDTVDRMAMAIINQVVAPRA